MAWSTVGARDQRPHCAGDGHVRQQRGGHHQPVAEISRVARRGRARHTDAAGRRWNSTWTLWGWICSRFRPTSSTDPRGWACRTCAATRPSCPCRPAAATSANAAPALRTSGIVGHGPAPGLRRARAEQRLRRACATGSSPASSAASPIEPPATDAAPAQQRQLCLPRHRGRGDPAQPRPDGRRRSSGSACLAAPEPSHALTAMGLPVDLSRPLRSTPGQGQSSRMWTMPLHPARSGKPAPSPMYHA